ncbi:MAG TPA: hypothetical protein VIE41_10075, partial [Methylomirabilota bacterium]
EGALENSASVLLHVAGRVRVVNGRLSNLAFGATFPDGRDTFWSADRLRQTWAGPGRVFLVSVVKPDASVVRTLPPDSVHLVIEAAGRRLYSNLAD